MDTRDPLLALELALARRDAAAIEGGYEAVIDEAFVEIGASGRVWSRVEIIEMLEAAPRTDAVSIENFDSDEIGPGVFLVVYDAVGTGHDGATHRRHRSSIWIRSGGTFRLRFHQGTPVPSS